MNEHGAPATSNKMYRVNAVSNGAYCTPPSMTSKYSTWVSDNWEVKTKLPGEILTNVPNSGHTSYMPTN